MTKTVPAKRKPMSGITLLIVGALIAGFAAYNYFVVLAPIADWVDTTGQVASVGERRIKKGDKVTIRHVPTVVYTDRAGTRHTQATIAGMKEPPKPGEKIDIFYNPKKPTEVLLGSVSGLKTMPIIFGVVGLIVLAFGAVIQFRRKTGDG